METQSDHRIRVGSRARIPAAGAQRALHGHKFQMLNDKGELGARKDTVIVIPRQSVKIAILADSPGYWPLHCHNTYHAEAGMATTFDYLS